jgi:hypothetical protein
MGEGNMNYSGSILKRHRWVLLVVCIVVGLGMEYVLSDQGYEKLLKLLGLAIAIGIILRLTLNATQKLSAGHHNKIIGEE